MTHMKLTSTLIFSFFCILSTSTIFSHKLKKETIGFTVVEGKIFLKKSGTTAQNGSLEISISGEKYPDSKRRNKAIFRKDNTISQNSKTIDEKSFVVMEADISAEEKRFLREIYSIALNKSFLTGWDFNKPVKTYAEESKLGWKGVTVTNGHITELYFPADVNLKGIIPRSIVALRYLESFSITENANLFGQLPQEMGQLLNLKYLQISYTGVTGLVPDFVNCQALKKVLLNNNKLDSLPANFKAVTAKVVVNLSNNSFNELDSVLPAMENIPENNAKSKRSTNEKSTDLRGASFSSTIVPSSECIPIIGEIVVDKCKTNVRATPSSQTIKPGSATSISLTSSVPGTIFKWEVVSNGASGALAGTGNTITQILTKTGAAAGLVVYTVTPILGTCPGRPINVVINVELLYTNSVKSGSFVRNNCGAGGTAIAVTYTVPANTYFSSSSQAEADTLAQNDVDTKGQNYANTTGTCSYLFGNNPKGDFFTNETCGGNQEPEVVSYNVQANTYFAATQEEADQLAQDDVYANGQAYANSQGGCTPIR
ncbi:DUF5977 domain-containing protein [Flavobacterium sp. ABG]|uniref:DUF5977 domain-containing protein n=1 Tax=Flavobacterium sp. ABG TaxID=1423322 RepID=UPI000AA74628|nr:DUF5977 domain-containing protein [Flavobacterium sp. ABG]